MALSTTAERLEGLVALAHQLGREDRQMAILGEGNVSARIGEGLLVKASGRSLGTLARDGLVACRAAGLVGMLDGGEIADDEVDRLLLAAKVDPAAAKPSVEAVFHAYLLGLPGIEWVGHTHPVAVNRILCSSRAAEFAARRMCPDEVVCCGPESAYVPYVDPGLALARAIRAEVAVFMGRHGGPPRVILLGNHGVITLGSSANAVLGAMLMCQKAAEIWLGAASLGGPRYLSDEDVKRIAGRSDEHYRQRALNL